MTTPRELSLGPLIQWWLESHLPSPRDESDLIKLADWQADRVQQWYEIDDHGKRRYNRCHDEDPKGKGKSPLGAMVDIVEFRGPVVFVGFAMGGEVYRCADHGCSCGGRLRYRPGQAMGTTWGSPGLPAPWVQVLGVSEKQVANTWLPLDYFLSANKSRVAAWLGLDAGRTIVYWRGRDDAKMEVVTASARSRTGQPITHATIDEPQEWTPAHGGPALVRAVLANLTKTGGWAHVTGNAPVLGMGSVSEILGYRYDDDARAWREAETPRVLQVRLRPSVPPREDMTRGELRPLIEEVYEHTPWTPVERILDDAEDRAAYPWSEVLRLFLNTPADVRTAGGWMSAEEWDEAEGVVQLRRDLPTFAVVRVSHDHRTAAIAAAQRQGEMVVVTSRVLTGAGDGYVAASDVEASLTDLRRSCPGRVVAAVRFSPRGKEYMRPRPGPEFATHGSFLEGIRQRLDAAGAVTVDMPSSRERLTPAAEAIKERLAGGLLVHDGDPVTASHMLAVVAKPAPKGWTIGAEEDAEGAPQPIVAAQAVMLAVHRAMTAPAVPTYRHGGIR